MAYFRFGRRKPRLTSGLRVYAIGDVHGCLQQLGELFQSIESDSADRGNARTKIILLGDMIDRGSHSAEVTKLLYAMRDSDKVVCLKGNHEKTMVDVLGGDLSALRFWVDFGGADTLCSWGVDAALVEALRNSEPVEFDVLDAFRAAVPKEIVDWLADLPLTHREGDYFFVHAGVRPGVALEKQKEDDLLWIREPFLSSWRRHGATIVHGHSETDEVTMSSSRIGIDTGAYRTGRLTALGLEGEQQWTLITGEAAEGQDDMELARA